MMFQLSLKTNASLACLLLLSSSPMALSSNVSGNDSETQEFTNNNWSHINAPLATEYSNQTHMVKIIFEFLGTQESDKKIFSALLSVNKDFYQIGAQIRYLKTYVAEGFPDRLRTLFPSFGTSHDQLSSFCESNITAVFPFLIKLPESNNHYFQEFRTLFSTDDKKAEDYHGLLKHCSHYTDFIPEKMDAYDKNDIITVLRNITKLDIRNWIVAQAPKLFAKDMDGSGRAYIIEVLVKITDPNIRNWIMAQAPKLFTEDMDSYGRVGIIKTFGNITNLDIRNEVLEQALKLFTKDMNGYGRAGIIKALGVITDLDIINWIVKQAPKLFTEDMDGVDRADIIKTLRKIADLGIRNWIVEQAPKFFTKDMNGEDRAKVIKVLGKFPDLKTLKLFMKKAPKLFTEDMNGKDRAKVIKVLGKFPDLKTLKLFMKKAPQLFTKDMDGKDKALIINVLGKFPDLKNLELFTKRMNGDDRVKMFNALRTVTDPNIIQEICKNAPRIFTEQTVKDYERASFFQGYVFAIVHPLR